MRFRFKKYHSCLTGVLLRKEIPELIEELKKLLQTLEEKNRVACFLDSSQGQCLTLTQSEFNRFLEIQEQDQQPPLKKAV